MIFRRCLSRSSQVIPNHNHNYQLRQQCRNHGSKVATRRCLSTASKSTRDEVVTTEPSVAGVETHSGSSIKTQPVQWDNDCNKQFKPFPWKPQELAPPRHFLRAILRECTYLPDPLARTYMRSHALARFRAYTPPSKPLSIIKERRHDQLKLARKALSELRRANAGGLKVLTKVLHMTYGRIGKRRHELLEPLLHVGPVSIQPANDPVDGHGTASPDQPPEERARRDAAKSWPSRHEPEKRYATNTALPALTPALRALLISQIKTSPPTSTRPHPKQLSPSIPDLNTWERPMPFKRVKNMTKAWYAKVLDRVMVPLPGSEWEELKKRALGQLEFSGPLKRRARPRLLVGHGGEASVLETELGLADTNSVETTLKRVDESARGKTLTKRFMQRRWADVFAQCPTMEWNAKTEKWKVVWGSQILDYHLKRKASGQDALYFPSSASDPALTSRSERSTRKVPTYQGRSVATTFGS